MSNKLIYSIGVFLSTYVTQPSFGANQTQVWLSPLKLIAGAITQSPPAEGDWAFCANENQQCSFTGPAYVRYGADGIYVYNSFTGGAACNNATFGDPDVGVVKQCAFLPIAVKPTPTPAAPPAIGNWTFCSNENENCNFQGSAQVRYGADGHYVYQTLSNGAACNNATFGDPDVNVVKQCYIIPSSAQWVHCADENGQCNFSGTAQVRYGKDGKYAYLTATNSIACNNATFGDPDVGVVKGCDYQASSSSPPATPTPSPNPTASPTPKPTASPTPAQGSGAPVGLPPSGASITPSGQRWYVRADGGTNLQCDGKTDAAYPGTGTAQHCAFKNPYYLWGNDVYGETPTWKIAGGDTVIFKGGPFRMGYKGPNTNDYWGQCPGDPYGCLMPTIPAGTASVHTKLLGEHFANCTSKTQLFGGYGLGAVINLSNAQHVDVACLELTDHASCTRVGAGGSDGCSTNNPIDDYSGEGIITNAGTSDVSLIDLDIHGFVSRGIIGPIGGVVNVNHVRLAYNGGGGWDFDDGRGTVSPEGSLVNAYYLTIQWNGCNEEYPITHAYPAKSCYDQNSGGYGDGVGTPDTKLNFTCDHCQFDHNTQDGLDLLHTSSSSIIVTNSTSFANMGQQYKLGAMDKVVFQNNVAIHNCNRMSQDISGATPGFNTHLSLFCRAAGDGYGLNFKPGGTYIFQNNTYVGYGATSYDIGCNGTDCSTANVTFQNNLNIGYASPFDGQLPGLFYYEPGITDAIWKHRDHNVYYNFRHGCPAGYANETCADPKLVSEPAYSSEAALDGLNLHPSNSSPLIGAGVQIPGLTTNQDGVPVSNPPDIGAY